MANEDGEIPVVIGPDESWEDFADRVQRQVGRGARTFACRQVGTPNPQTMILIVNGGPLRADLVSQVFAVAPDPSVHSLWWPLYEQAVATYALDYHELQRAHERGEAADVVKACLFNVDASRKALDAVIMERLRGPR